MDALTALRTACQVGYLAVGLEAATPDAPWIVFLIQGRLLNASSAVILIIVKNTYLGLAAL